jgi:hypothetical protein
MGRSALVVAALLAAVLLASALTLASTVDFREEDLVSENVLWALYERWHGRHADQHAVPLRRVPPQHVNSVREECSREKAREEHAEEKS